MDYCLSCDSGSDWIFSLFLVVSTLVLCSINGRLRNDNGVDCYARMLVVNGTVVNGSVYFGVIGPSFRVA